MMCGIVYSTCKQSLVLKAKETHNFDECSGRTGLNRSLLAFQHDSRTVKEVFYFTTNSNRQGKNLVYKSYSLYIQDVTRTRYLGSALKVRTSFITASCIMQRLPPNIREGRQANGLQLRTANMMRTRMSFLLL
jgi:hypothetical protein